MNRRSFLTRAALFAGASSLPVGAIAAEAQPATFRLLSDPVVTNPAPDGVSVLWATNGPATGWVEYGETPNLGLRAGGSDEGLFPFDERTFKVRLESLKPGTRYFYRVHACRIEFRNAYKIIREEEVTAGPFSFVTPNPAAAETRFTVWNDTHENSTTLQGLHAAHSEAPGDFLLWNGDVVNEVDSEEKMVGQFLSPAGLPFAATTPYYYVRGNHDVRGPAARRVARFVDVPAGKYFYSFRQGPLAAIVLDTGEDKPDTHPVYAGLNDFAAFRSAQAEWLAREIEKPHFKSAPFRILFCHIPLWWHDEKAVGDYCLDGRAKWHDLLVKAKVQLVISGHTHQADWYPANDQHPYGQLIGGGPKPSAATYIRGHATGDRLKVQHHRLDGSILHEFEVTA